MDTYEQAVSFTKSFISKHNLFLRCSTPVVSECEPDCNPRVSKFGGQFPYLDGESVPRCTVCDQFPMMAAQLYVPSLPAYVQELFPERERRSLLVLGICPECLGSHGYHIRSYAEDELDRLVYHADEGRDWARPEYHERRVFPRIPFSPQPYDAYDEQRQYFHHCTVVDWQDSEMVPYTSLRSVQELLKKEGIDNNNRYFLVAHSINMQNNVSGNTYLCGWPHFCDGDQTPEDFRILLNMCESEAATLGWGDCGTAQLWIGTGKNEGKYMFTCSSH